MVVTNLAGVLPNWATSTLSYVLQGKHDEHACICRSHGFNFLWFNSSILGSLDLEAEELLSHIRLPSHVQVLEWETHDRVVCRLWQVADLIW